MSAVNDEDRVYTAIKIPECNINRENYLIQWIPRCIEEWSKQWHLYIRVYIFTKW